MNRIALVLWGLLGVGLVAWAAHARDPLPVMAVPPTQQELPAAATLSTIQWFGALVRLDAWPVRGGAPDVILWSDASEGTIRYQRVP